MRFLLSGSESMQSPPEPLKQRRLPDLRFERRLIVLSSSSLYARDYRTTQMTWVPSDESWTKCLNSSLMARASWTLGPNAVGAVP